MECLGLSIAGPLRSVRHCLQVGRVSSKLRFARDAPANQLTTLLVGLRAVPALPTEVSMICLNGHVKIRSAEPNSQDYP